MPTPTTPQLAPFWSTFFPDDPYAGFPVESWELDLQGWGSADPVFAHVIDVVRPRVIIEVGSWKGASAIHMAREAKELGLGTSIVCVDTWLGSPEHFFKRDHPAYWDSLRIRHGFPHIYEQFLANIIHTGQHDVVVPLPQTSDNAARILSRLGVAADLIYIDAAHSYDPVLADLSNYWRLLTPEGVLVGDDYRHKPVARAAAAFAEANNLELKVSKSGKKYAFAGPARRSLPWPA